VTDLDGVGRAAAQELVESSAPDLAAHFADLQRMRRRRGVAKLVAAGAATALAVGGWQLAGSERDGDVQPAAPVHLVLSDARIASTELVANVETHQDGGSIDHDRFDGITDDGFVVRSRYTYDGDLSEYALFDPETGDTEWLPTPAWDVGDPFPVSLTSESLTFLDLRNAGRFALLTFDRDTDQWRRSVFEKPEDVDRFFGFTALVGDDDRVYLMNPAEQVSWFSVARDGTGLRPEPDLDGTTVAFSETVRATASPTGRVVVDREGEPAQVVSEALPDGCALEPTSLPTVALAGDWPVVSYPCADGALTSVYDRAGHLYVDLVGDVAVGGAGPNHVLLTNADGTFALSLARRELFQVDVGNTSGFTGGRDVVGGLALWGVDADHNPDVFSLSYWVGRLP